VSNSTDGDPVGVCNSPNTGRTPHRRNPCCDNWRACADAGDHDPVREAQEKLNAAAFRVWVERSDDAMLLLGFALLAFSAAGGRIESPDLSALADGGGTHRE
jgi:hypothetical protein